MVQRIDQLLQCCTVKITVPAQMGWGTGFFVAPGLILTCNHVVKALKLDTTAEISCHQQEGVTEAALVKRIPELDLALLQYSSSQVTDLPCVYLDQEFQPTDDFYTYGYPDNFPDGASVTSQCEGDAQENGVPLILFKSGLIRPGFSGSPLLNLRTGKVCGIVKFTRDRSIDLGGGAIPAAAILQQFKTLAQQQQTFHQQDPRWSTLLPALVADFATVSRILERIEATTATREDLEMLRQVVQHQSQQMMQLGKYSITISEISKGQNIQIGDRIYVEIDDEAMKAIVAEIQRGVSSANSGIPSNLPRSGVLEFVGRTEAMLQLHQLLQQGDRVAISAIAGMGGIGKTELALQYALAYQQTYLGGLCWLQARSGNVGTQLLRFGQACLGLTPPDGLELTDQVKYCWRNWRSGDVLLVFDDVTEYQAIESYLPPVTDPRFKVLVTTRLQLGRSVNQLELDVLNEASALMLLASLVKGDRIQAQLGEAKQLCNQLGYLPLGLELAGRYLNRKVDLSIAALRQRLEKQHLAAKALGETDADMTANLGVAAAFQLSWADLSAAVQQLGCVLSLFAAAPITWSLVEQCFPEHDSEEVEEWRDNELLNLHLLQQVANATYRLHPLIQAFFQSQLEQSPQQNKLKQKFCRAITNAAKQITENPTYEETLRIAPLIPHLSRVAITLTENLEPGDLIHPYVGLGRFYKGQGLYAEARLWYSRCLSQSREKLGDEHPDVATSLNNLAMLYSKQGHYSEAEPLLRQALELRQRLLGEEHPDVSTSLNNIAMLYSKQGRYSEAEPLYQRVLKIDKRCYGEDNPEVAIDLNNLALLYNNQGRYSEAELLLQQALKLRQRLLGEEHPDVATSLNNLAGIYDSQNRYSEAEPLYQQALELLKRMLGEEHPFVARSLNNLAGIYYNQGRYNEAELLYIQSLKLRRRLLGEDHPDVAISFNNLAMLYSNQKRYSEAEPLYQQALDLLKRMLGEEHPFVANIINNLAMLYYNQEHYDRADHFLQQALKLRRMLLGEEHPDVGRSLDNLGMLQKAQGRQQEAEASCLAALAILETGLGPDHPCTVRCRENLKQLHNQSV